MPEINNQIKEKSKISNEVKTLLFTLEYPPFHGGIANYYENLVKYWPSFAPSYAEATEGKKAMEGKPSDSLSVLHNNNSQLINNKLPALKWLPAIIALWRVIKSEKIDYVLVGHILPLGTVAWLVSRLTKIKYAVILHGMDLGMATGVPRKKWLTKKILNQADKIICGNNYTAVLVKNLISEASKIFVINPGVDTTITHNAQGVTELKKKYNLDNKIVVLTVGRLVKRKGVDKVLESLPEVLKKIPNLVYVIIGNGPDLEAIKLQVTNYQLQKEVLIISDAHDEERNAWYALCDIFIMMARSEGGDFEGFGIVYLEAGLHGKPVIAGDSGGVRDAVEDNLSGLLVDPTDAAAISRALVGLAQDETLRRQLGEQGRQRVLARFNWEKQVEKIYKILCNG